MCLPDQTGRVVAPGEVVAQVNTQVPVAGDHFHRRPSDLQREVGMSAPSEVHNRLLLLCVVFFEVQRCQMGPLDFVCSPAARSNLNIIEQLNTAMLQQKSASVRASLEVFLEALDSAKSQMGLDCQTAILKRLKHNVQNHLKILNSLEIKMMSSRYCPPTKLGTPSVVSKNLVWLVMVYQGVLQDNLTLNETDTADPMAWRSVDFLGVFRVLGGALSVLGGALGILGVFRVLGGALSVSGGALGVLGGALSVLGRVFRVLGGTLSVLGGALDILGGVLTF
ncbi:hypothetical protein NFI96_023698 [Prochilodus magdalenae]|nr:hypothetical protein NFI96_023698 [Prochilodus magdalenae]